MHALILQHKSTPAGVIIVHGTHEVVLIGQTPLSKALYSDYVKGFRFFVFDRKTFQKREKIVTAKDLKNFMETGTVFYSHANMTLEQKDFPDLNMRNIIINDTIYELEEINGNQ